MRISQIAFMFISGMAASGWALNGFNGIVMGLGVGFCLVAVCAAATKIP
jgi:anaerobic glycerol-3-phosphate dehydrogenase